MTDQLKSLLARFEQASRQLPEVTFSFATLERKPSLQGEAQAVSHYRDLAKEGLRYVPASYLWDENLLVPSFPPEVLWSLSVIAIDWRLGRSKVGVPFITVRARKDHKRHDGAVAPAGLGLLSPFRFSNHIVTEITERWSEKGIVVESVEVANHLQCFHDSVMAVGLLLYRESLTPSVDNQVPSYESVVRLIWDIDDLVAAAEKCGKNVVETDPSQAGFAFMALRGGAIPVRLGIQWTSDDLEHFTPKVHGWDYRATSALHNVIPLLWELHSTIDMKPYGSVPFDFSQHPIVPQRIIDALNSIISDLRKSITALGTDRELIASPTLTVADVLAGGPNPLPTTPDFLAVVKDVLEKFRSDVEHGAGWKLIHARNEDDVQIFFHTIVRTRCEFLDIDVSREPNAGRGPLDFKFSRGCDRAAAELKLAGSPKLLHGIQKQLPQYMLSERAKHGFYVVIGFDRPDMQRADNLRDQVRAVNESKGLSIELIIVDASSDKPSASKLP